MVENNRRTKLLPKIIAGQLSVGLLICLVAIITIVYAQGYRFNPKNFRFYKTGVVVIDYLPWDAYIHVNGTTLRSKPPYAVNLPPGYYDLSISKANFIDWHQRVRVESASVNVFKDVLLFKSNIEINDLSDNQKIAYLNSPSDVLARNANNTLTSNKYDIWVGDQLITRFADPIQNVIWYPDLAHIIFQQGDEIRIIDKYGNNDTLLAKLSSKTPTRFNVGGGGQELYFIDNGKYKIAIIR